MEKELLINEMVEQLEKEYKGEVTKELIEEKVLEVINRFEEEFKDVANMIEMIAKAIAEAIVNMIEGIKKLSELIVETFNGLQMKEEYTRQDLTKEEILRMLELIKGIKEDEELYEDFKLDNKIWEVLIVDFVSSQTDEELLNSEYFKNKILEFFDRNYLAVYDVFLAMSQVDLEDKEDCKQYLEELGLDNIDIQIWEKINGVD